MNRLGKQTLLRISGVLFLLAGVAFRFSPARWMALVEGTLGLAMLVLSIRAGRES